MSKTEKTTWFETLEMLDISLFSSVCFFLISLKLQHTPYTNHHILLNSLRDYYIIWNLHPLLIRISSLICIHFGLKTINILKKRCGYFFNENLTVFSLMRCDECIKLFESSKSAAATTTQRARIDRLLGATLNTTQVNRINTCVSFNFAHFAVALFCI